LTRRIVFLNLALIALAGILVTTLRAKRKEAKKNETAVLRLRLAPKAVLEPPALRPVAPVTPANYLPVAENMLFSKDRNPTVIIEPPPVKPEPPMPPLPRYHGQMAIGDPIALLSTDKLAQKSYHAGEAIGDFKLISFSREKIAFEWMGKTVERKPEDLAPKEAAVQPAQAAAGAKPAPLSAAAAARAGLPPPAAPRAASAADGFTSPAPSSAPPVTSLGDGNSAGASKTPTGMGSEITDGVRNCLPTDKSPAGTILEGHKKIVLESMFGPICRWEPVK